MGNFQEAKKIVRQYFDAMEHCSVEEIPSVLSQYMADDYNWKGVYPFGELNGQEAVCERFWTPLKKALPKMQRRLDVFIGGNNCLKEEPEQWVLSTGNFLGLFDEDWLGIRHTRKINCLRFAEFNCVENGKITKTGLFVDILGFMNQAGVNPLPPSTGTYFVYPGPRDHNGLYFEDRPDSERMETMALINKMCDDYAEFAKSGVTDYAAWSDNFRLNFAEDFIWYGPCGVGATFTIPRYVEQHQGPFMATLAGNSGSTHVCRVSEGAFGGFFGWPNFTVTPTGGFMGLPAGGEKLTSMQVVDVYYRKNGKLSENWVYIDFLGWLAQQGVDVLKRTADILNP